MARSTFFSSAPMLSLGCVVVPMLLQMPVAQAGEVTFRPRADIGVAQYSIDFGSTSQSFSTLTGPLQISTTKIEVSGTLPTAGAGLTVFFDKFYLDLSAQASLEESATFDNTFSMTSPFMASNTNANYKGDINRNELGLTFGYGVTDTTAVFAGWKWTESNIDNIYGSAQMVALDGTPIGLFEESANFRFKYNGPFIGAAVAWPISAGAFNGNLGLNVALAYLQAELNVSNDVATLNGIQLIPSTAEIFETSGSSIGSVIGIAWTGTTGIDRLTYSIGLNGYRYDFDADQTGKADVTETFIQLKLGLAYAF